MCTSINSRNIIVNKAWRTYHLFALIEEASNSMSYKRSEHNRLKNICVHMKGNLIDFTPFCTKNGWNLTTLWWKNSNWNRFNLISIYYPFITRKKGKVEIRCVLFSPHAHVRKICSHAQDVSSNTFNSICSSWGSLNCNRYPCKPQFYEYSFVFGHRHIYLYKMKSKIKGYSIKYFSFYLLRSYTTYFKICNWTLI